MSSNYLYLLETNRKPWNEKIEKKVNTFLIQEERSSKHKEVPENVKNLMPSLAAEEDRWKAIYKKAHDDNDEHTMQITSLFLSFISLLKAVVEQPKICGWLSSLLSQLHLAAVSDDNEKHKEHVKRITDRL